MCSELGLLIGNMCFRKRLIYKYTWDRVAHGVLMDSAVKDYVVVPVHLRGRLLDVNVLRAVAGGISDYYLVGKVIRVNGGLSCEREGMFGNGKC